MKTLIKPKEGLKILNPVSKLFLGVEGELVDLSTYWKRLIKDGDVFIVESTEEKLIEKQEEKKEIKIGGKK